MQIQVACFSYGFSDGEVISLHQKSDNTFCSEILVPDRDTLAGDERWLALFLEGKEVDADVIPGTDICGLLVVDNDGTCPFSNHSILYSS